LKLFTKKFVVVYLDDILIYNLCSAEHLDHVRRVPKTLHDNKLYINLKKCSFMLDRLLFLGFVVSADKIRVDEEKDRAIK
jgi:hypothetical protein